MDSNKHNLQTVSFEEAVLKAKVAQICDAVGYHAITQDSSNILVDIYRRTIHHLARHCKDAANNNRRIEPTLIDLMQAYDFVGISIPELQEHIETVKIPLIIEVEHEELEKPANRIQRNLLIDDLLEAEKNSHLEDQDDCDNKAVSEVEEEDKPSVPLLKDTYEEIANKFTNVQPVSADKKIRLGGRILLVANTKLKISAPIPPDPVPSTSGAESKQDKKRKKKELEKKKKDLIAQPSPVKQTKGKRKKLKLSKEFILPEQTPEKEKEKGRRGGKKSSGKKTKVAIKPLDLTAAEPPSFFPIEKERLEPVKISTEVLPSPKLPKETKGKRKKRTSDEFATTNETASPVKESKAPAKGKGGPRKKLKTTVTPLDPSIAEPPSFFPILEIKPDPDLEVNILNPTPPPPLPPPPPPAPIIETPPPTTSKQTKGKKKKKSSSSNQFAIVTETVTAAEEKEWFCPACGGPDDGDLMVQCDTCQEWYHLVCTGLSKPPEDDENWECDICAIKIRAQNQAKAQAQTMIQTQPKAQVQVKAQSQAKAQKHRPQTPLESIIKLKTPEPSVSSTPPPPTPAQVVASTSQDDLCPECNLPDDGTMMIQCDDPFCAKWFHGKCVNLLQEPKEDDSWFCKACVDKQQSAFKRRRRPK